MCVFVTIGVDLFLLFRMLVLFVVCDVLWYIFHIFAGKIMNMLKVHLKHVRLCISSENIFPWLRLHKAFSSHHVVLWRLAPQLSLHEAHFLENLTFGVSLGQRFATIRVMVLGSSRSLKVFTRTTFSCHRRVA